MAPTTTTIELPTPLYRQLQALAEDEQSDLIELLSRLINLAASQQVDDEDSAPALRSILARATDLGVSDLSAQHDHYLYGVEKR